MVAAKLPLIFITMSAMFRFHGGIFDWLMRFYVMWYKHFVSFYVFVL